MRMTALDCSVRIWLVNSGQGNPRAEPGLQAIMHTLLFPRRPGPVTDDELEELAKQIKLDQAG